MAKKICEHGTNMVIYEEDEECGYCYWVGVVDRLDEQNHELENENIRLEEELENIKKHMSA
ncbi:MAG TPA: hypothetical protein DCY12_08835 [Candidatus Atribacteria bacterium]|nr:hypothetical protein [Candidatus Atribacteria bacterium]